MDIVTLAAAMAYTKKTADALGAVKGAPCTIQGITDIEGGHRITFAWTSASGKVETSNLDVMNGEQGQQGEPGQPGAQGLPGNDGTSPAVTITDIPGGHRVTITDAAHPEGQSFDVMDGKGGSDAKVFVAEYNVTTAQEIIAYLDAAEEPFAPILIKRGNDYYTAITAQKQAENKVIIRSFASLSGDYYVFMYTITDGSWAASNYPLQKKGDAYTKAETDALLANKAAQSSVVALQRTAEDLRLANEATESELTEFKDSIVIDLGGIVESLNAKQDKPAYVVDKPEGSSPVLGNVVQVGSLTNTDGTEYGIFEFYYKTSALPAADATKTYSFSPLLDDYTIFDFIDQSGITSNGHVISSGRTDGTNRIIIQQFSKNNKNVMLRAYGDYTEQTALLRIKFIGTKNV